MAKKKALIKTDSHSFSPAEYTPTKSRAALLAGGLEFDPKKYEFNEAFVPANIKNPMEVHTTQEMVEAMKADPKIELEARVIAIGKNRWTTGLIERDDFIRSFERKNTKRLRESIDGFNTDQNDFSSSRVGEDYTPLLGGPFAKQLYIRDYLRMHSAAFYAFHHDPTARAVVNIMTDFTLSRGWELTTENRAAQALWDAFAKVNDLNTQMEQFAQEVCTYGESMWYWLPGNERFIVFNPKPGQEIPRAMIPRVRVLDPSNIAEVITHPEDITHVLAYQFLAPTQYQTYTTPGVASSKFIFQQIPASLIQHYKINAASNEKRGRSDYFPALGYMKRLRDTVNYSVIGMQKAAAWSIDTTIKGDDSDIQAYKDAMAELGSIPPAGSEFIHTEGVTRSYLSNSAAGKSSESPTFSWCLSMIACSTGIPVSYLGTHLSGGQTRASALVATEPVAKRFERRQKLYERVLQEMFTRLMERAGVKGAECEVTFPELITQDRSAKLRDIDLAESRGFISKSRAATLFAKELGVSNYDYRKEMADIDREQMGPSSLNPLTDPGIEKTPPAEDTAGLTGTEKADIKDQETTT